MKEKTDPITVTPENKEHWLKLRSENINSTEISCLFDMNPYMTKFELWHKLRSREITRIEESERMAWGNALESAIAAEAARRNNWKIEPFKDYLYIPDYRIGSSFDYEILPESGVYALLEVKNVDSMAYNKNWKEYSIDENSFVDGEAPPHIELQVQHQMLISTIDTAFICALVGGNQLKIFKRTANHKLHDIIISSAQKFWQSIHDNKPPKIDYDRDANFLILLNDFAEPNKTIQGDEELDALVEGYNVVSKGIKELEDQKTVFKAKILEHIKDAEKVKSDLYTISAGITPEAQVSFTRKSFRNFKITNKKQQTNETTQTKET